MEIRLLVVLLFACFRELMFEFKLLHIFNGWSASVVRYYVLKIKGLHFRLANLINLSLREKMERLERLSLYANSSVLEFLSVKLFDIFLRGIELLWFLFLA
jgi:hypothetical protein